MGRVRFERISELSTSTGTGDMVMAGAAGANMRTFASKCTVGDTFHYMIEGLGGIQGEWEHGIGSYSATNTLTRTTVIASSNGDAAVTFSAGTKRVSMAPLANPYETRTIPVLVGAMQARTTNGPASGSAESTTNKVMQRTLDFDASTAEYAQVVIPMPKSWDEGTVMVQFIWRATGTGNVVWGCQAVALSDDDVYDAAFGTAQTVTDGVTATTDLMESAFTSAITIAGSPAAEDLVCFQFYRDAANGSDTCTVDAQLLGVRIKYAVNAGDDS